MGSVQWGYCIQWVSPVGQSSGFYPVTLSHTPLGSTVWIYRLPRGLNPLDLTPLGGGNDRMRAAGQCPEGLCDKKTRLQERVFYDFFNISSFSETHVACTASVTLSQ